MLYTRQLRFNRTNGVMSVYVTAGQHVQAGDILASLIFTDEEMLINHRSTELRLEIFERGFISERNRHRDNINDLRTRLAYAYGILYDRLSLQLQREQLQYERFRINSNTARQRLVQTLSDLDEAMAPSLIAAPFDGVILSTTSIADGTFLTGHPIIIVIADESNYGFYINTNEQIFLPPPPLRYAIVRYYDIITIRSDVIEFDARIITDPWAAGQRSGLVFRLLPLVYITDIVEYLHELLGTNFSTVITHTLSANSVVLPLSAVYPEGARHYVYIYENGNMGKRYVSIGVRVGNYVQIISGLYEGQLVVILP